VPQVVPPLSVHWSRGSCPTATSVQVPALPASAHDRQVPLQLEAQQTPCWHRPDAHSVPAAQVPPSGFFEQTPPLQMLGATQSVLVEQRVRQRPLVQQLYAPHDRPVGGWQTPAPLQVRGGVYVAPVQLPAAHWVPLE